MASLELKAEHTVALEEKRSNGNEEGRTIIAFATQKAGNAKEAAQSQTRMTLQRGLKQYPKAALWSLLLSTSIVMVAYDTILLNSFYAYPSFQRKYGRPSGGHGKYQIPARWQSGLSNGSNVGGIVGLILNGFLSDALGHKTVMLGALVAITGFIFIPFFAPNLAVLEVGEILCGVPWGLFQGLTTAYASEVTPVVLRPYLTSYINLCWVFGHFIGAGVLRSLLDRNDKWSYKIPFAVQWIWPVPLFLGVCFAPQSPWWLLRKGKLDEAAKSLHRLTSRPTSAEITDALELMIQTNDIELETQRGTSYLDCLRGTDLRRTEIVVMVYVIQYLHGNGLAGYSTYFYEQAGLSAAYSFDLTMGQYALGFLCTILSWFLMAHFGRRTLYLAGMLLSTVLLFAIGFVSLAPSTSSAASWATGSLLLVFFAIHSTFIGPVLYAIVGEIPSTRLRQKSIVIAASAWSDRGIVNSALTPYMLNPSAWNWGGKAGFFWGGICCFAGVWCWFRLPEGKGRTFGELDLLFQHRVSARKFWGAEVDLGRGRVVVR